MIDVPRVDYRPITRPRQRGGADYLRPHAGVTDEYARDLMHLLRRVSKATRRPGTQGFLTAKREQVTRALVAFARYDVARPTYRAIREQTPACFDSISETIHVLEVVGVLEVTRHPRDETPEYHPNSYRWKPVPSRFEAAECDEWVETHAARLRELQEAQDRAILGLAWGLATFVIGGRRALAYFAAQREIAEARCSENRRETKQYLYPKVPLSTPSEPETKAATPPAGSRLYPEDWLEQLRARTRQQGVMGRMEARAQIANRRRPPRNST